MIERWIVYRKTDKLTLYLYVNPSGMFGWSSRVRCRYTCQAAADYHARRYGGEVMLHATYEDTPQHEALATR